MIEINLYGPFREAVGAKTVERPVNDGDTVETVLANLAEEHPALADRLFEDGTLRDSINVMKNGTNVKLIDGGETSVGSGDRLSVVVSLEGGAVSLDTDDWRRASGKLGWVGDPPLDTPTRRDRAPKSPLSDWNGMTWSQAGTCSSGIVPSRFQPRRS